MLRKKRRSRTHAPAAVLFTDGKNEAGKTQLCVYAQCQYGGKVAGPVWGHAQASVGRVLATLTKECDCGRPFHKAREYQGRRVLVPAGRG